MLSNVAFAATQAVAIEDFDFNPKTITINVGDSITWTNRGGETHTSTSNAGVWDSGSLAPGASKTVAFNVAGTFAYHCAIHTFMTGTITVTGAVATTAPPPTPTPPPPTTAPPTVAPTTAPPAATTVAPTAAPPAAATAAPTTAGPTAAPTTAISTATAASTTAPVGAASPSSSAIPPLAAASPTPAAGDAGPLPLVIGGLAVVAIAGVAFYLMRRR